MTPVAWISIWILLSIVSVSTWAVLRLARNLGQLAQREARHCREIGELHDVMALLIEHIDHRTAEHLPPDVVKFMLTARQRWVRTSTAQGRDGDDDRTA